MRRISIGDDISLLGIFIAVAALIVYGSLYPWQFVAKTLPASPLWLLFHSWGAATGRRFVADEIVNVLLYMPFGASGYLALRSVWKPVALGALLSGCVEMTQLFTPHRNCSTEDLLTNILGSALGVSAGLVFVRAGGPLPVRYRGASTALLFCGVAALTAPFFPVPNLPGWREKIAAFAYGPVLSPLPLISGIAWWMAMGLMARFAGPWIWLAVLLVPGQIAIVTRQPFPVDVIGALCGVGLSRLKPGKARAAGGFLAAIVIRGVLPFHLSAQPHDFQWLPFGGFLAMDWQFGMQVLLEKLFWYGSALWLLRRAGMGWPRAIALVCALLAGIEGIQTRLPGRTAEITDPLLALLEGLGLQAIMRIHDQSPIRSDSRRSGEQSSGSVRGFRR